MAATSEEIECLYTICSSIAAASRRPSPLTRDAQSEIIELLDLLPQLFGSDGHIGRLEALLTCGALPLETVARLTFDNTPSVDVQRFAMKTLVALVSICAVPSALPQLAPRIREALQAVSFAERLATVIAAPAGTGAPTGLAGGSPSSGAPLSAAAAAAAAQVQCGAAELLFVVLVKLPTMGVALRPRIGSIFSALWGLGLRGTSDAGHDAASFLCAILRVLVDNHADLFVINNAAASPHADGNDASGADHYSGGGSFVQRAVMALQTIAEGGSKGASSGSNAAVLLIETLNEVAVRHAQAWHDLCRPSATQAFFHVLTRHLLLDGGAQATGHSSGAGGGEVARALLHLSQTLLLRESRTADGFLLFPKLVAANWWLPTLERPTVATTALLRHVALNLHRPRDMRALCLFFSEAFPPLCALLVGASASSGATQASTVQTDAAIVLTVCGKLPAVRERVAAMVRGYEAWACSLGEGVVSLVRRFGAAALDGAALVDDQGTLLNDGSQVLEFEEYEPGSVAAALLDEQQRRSTAAADGGGAFAGASDGAVLEEQLRLFDAQSAREREQSAVLGVALLCEAAHRMLGCGVGGLPTAGSGGGLGAFTGAGGGGVRGAAARRRAAAAALAGAATHGTDERTLLQHVDAHQNLSSLHNNNSHNWSGAGSDLGFGATPDAAAAADLHTPRAVRRPGGRSASPPQGPPTPYGIPFGGRAGAGAGAAAAVVTPTRARRAGQSPVRAAGTPQNKAPFRPSSPAPSLSSRAAIGTTGVAPQHRTAVVGGGGGGTPLRSRLPAGLRPDLQDAQDYLMTAIAMHLPISLGIHYNRKTKAAPVRRGEAANGYPFAQPIHRNTQQSWDIHDIQRGELYVLFLPFAKLNEQQLLEEIDTVQRHLLSTRRSLVVTPGTLRSRRWFLHDMLNYVLPKTELLLRDLLEMCRSFGADDVRYQLGVIRLTDEDERDRGGAVAAALERADRAMPAEILRLSSGPFREVLHSGNLPYVLTRLQRHFSGQPPPGGGSGAAKGGGGSVMEALGGIGSYAGRQQHHAGQQPPDHEHHDPLHYEIADIDEEIRRLERTAVNLGTGDRTRAGLGAGAPSAALANDDIFAAVATVDDRSRRGGEDDDDDDDAESDFGPTRFPGQAARDVSRYLTHYGGDNAAEESLPDHLLDRLRGFGEDGAFGEMATVHDGASTVGDGLSRRALANRNRDGSGGNLMSDFDAMYAAVEGHV